MPNSSTTVRRLHGSRKPFASGTTNTGTPLSSGRGLPGVLLVELLSYSYQFASPYRWIETQDLFFEHYKFERFIEIGPSPTRTAYFQFEDDPEVTSESDSGTEAATPMPSPSPTTPVVVATPTPVPTTAPAASIEDVPICAVDILAAIVSQRLKKQLSEISPSPRLSRISLTASRLFKTRLWAIFEFSTAPDKGEELDASLGSNWSLVACHWWQDDWWL